MGDTTPNTEIKTVVQAVPTAPNPAMEHTGSDAERMKALATKLDTLVSGMSEAKAEDGARWAELNDERVKVGQELHDLKAKEEAREREAETAKAIDEAKAATDSIRAFLAGQREPSKAADIGGNFQVGNATAQGGFLAAVSMSRSSDYEEQQSGKAMLKDLGIPYEKAWGKATLGTTDATGGYIIPNNIVDQFMRPGLYRNKFRTLLTLVNGVTTAGVDIPWRSAAPNVAVIAAFGDTKENVDLTYNGYTATMYTLARIHDVSKQFLRQSQGAAEQDVLTELGDAFGRGEATYILTGTGSSQPYGLVTALDNAPATFRSTFTAAATLAGSVATGIATMAGDLGARDRDDGLSVLLNAADYWQMLRQGADEAGFYFNPAAGPTAINVPAGTLISPFGIPVYPDSILASDRAICGQFGALKLYLGEGFRIDSSDIANERWDRNLVGFRGEMEMGLDARPAVFTGAFQDITDIVS